MSCLGIRTRVACTQRVAEAERLSEPRKTEPSRNERLRFFDQSCADGSIVIAALRGRIPPGGKELAKPGSNQRVFSNWPNRGWNGKYRSGGRKIRSSGRHGKPSARRRSPSALPVKSQRCVGIELHALSGIRPDTHHPT